MAAAGMISKTVAQDVNRSVQAHPKIADGTQPGYGGGLSWLTVVADETGIPAYWSRGRDQWLREFIDAPINDILAGTLTTVTSKVATTNWYLEGPRRIMPKLRQMLLVESNFGAGWSEMIQKVVRDYCSQDSGGWVERIRLKGNTAGSAVGFASLDNARMYITGDPEWPVKYQPIEPADTPDGMVPMHRSQFIHICDSPSSRIEHLGVGHCAVSRSITMARTLGLITRYEWERLGDLPPAGFLFLNNLNQMQWDDLVKSYDVRQQQQGNKVWREIMVAFGLDPALPITAEFFNFSELPEHFNKRETFEIILYMFALAFKIDPREIYPVSAGLLGSAGSDAKMAHMKGRTKGNALILTDLERGLNDGYSLPPSVLFKFDYEDEEEARGRAETQWRQARFLGELYKMGNAEIQPIISREEARRWLLRNNMMTEDDLGMTPPEIQVPDVRLKTGHVDLGPRVRVYRDGHTIDLSRRVWPGALVAAARVQEILEKKATATKGAR